LKPATEKMESFTQTESVDENLEKMLKDRVEALENELAD